MFITRIRLPRPSQGAAKAGAAGRKPQLRRGRGAEEGGAAFHCVTALSRSQAGELVALQARCRLTGVGKVTWRCCTTSFATWGEEGCLAVPAFRCQPSVPTQWELLNGVHFCIGLGFSKGMSPVEKRGRKQMPFGSPREVSCTFHQVSDLISQRSFKWGETRVLISASLSTCSQV